MMAIDADALLERVWSEKIQAQTHGREFSTCFMSPGGTPSTEWWYVEDLIENAPTIETERKKGKWIKREVSRQIHGISCSAPNYQCSVCKKWWFHNGEGLKWYKFCPECGADMRGDDHDL